MDTEDIEVVPYDPKWPLLFQTEADKIKAALGSQFAGIHHVGSTAVPGLAAKPNIDIVAEVKTLTFDHQPLADLGYDYRGGFHLPLRKSFTYRSPKLSVNLHIFEKDDPEVALNLAFRDYLRTHTDMQKSYEALKYRLIQDEASHQKRGPMYRGYTLGKNDLIQDILNASGFDRVRFVICTHDKEWEAVRNFRRDYFLAHNQKEDPDTWTFEHEEHRHLVLYQGVQIIGYAHIHLWPHNQATLQMLMIDPKHAGKGHDQTLMALIDKWLKLEGVKMTAV